MKVPGIAVVDLGASGGRITVARRRGDGGLSFETVHEFSHPVHVFTQKGGSGRVTRRYWNPGVIYDNIVAGLRAVPGDVDLHSVGIDGWGSDGAWLDADGDILGLPAQGRDRRWNQANAEIETIMSDRRRFALTGVRNESFCPINLLYWHARHNPKLMELADVFMPMPALLTYWLCGERAAERTWMGTSQLLDLDGGYSHEVFGKLGLPEDKMPPVVNPGAVLGKLHDSVAGLAGHANCRVIVPAQHDTADAYAAAAASAGAGPHTLIISAGTWWLSGLATGKAAVSDAAYDAILTNVPGDGGWITHHIGFGSWPAQELRRQWSGEDGREMSWDEFNSLAMRDEGAAVAIDTNDPRLLAPDNMAAALAECAGLDAADRPRLARVVYDGLSAMTKKIASNLSGAVGVDLKDILIIGGGARNDCLNQRLAAATGMPVRCALPNATTLGNAFIQGRALGWFASLAEAGRATPAGPVREFTP